MNQLATQSLPQDDIDPLDALMDESQLDALLIESTDLEDDSFSLDALMAESLEAQKERDLEKELRKRQARGNLPKEEYDANAALLRQWELKREWDAVGNVLVFQRQMCSHCGTFHNVFSGFYEKHAHRRIAGTTRMVKMVKLDKDLPKEVKYEDETVNICHTCADLQGDWELEDDSNEFGSNFSTTDEVENG